MKQPNELAKELIDVIEGSGQSINNRHIHLLAENMTQRGYLMSVDRFGINRSDKGPLAKCSFEETPKILFDAALYGEYDNLDGVSANIMVGQVPHCGTGITDVLLDEVKFINQVKDTDDEIIFDEEIEACNEENFNFGIDISNIGTLYTFPNNDQAGEWLSLDFNLPFYTNDLNNNYYNQLFINPNGWVGFETDSDAWDNTSIPTNQINGAAIFALWDDLNPVNENCNQYCSGNVYTHGNDDRFVIWFDEVAHWWTNFEDSYYDFQIIIYPNGDIDVNYRSLTGTHDATIGIQNSTGTDGIQVSSGSGFASAQKSLLFSSGISWLDFDGNLSGQLEYGSSMTHDFIVNYHNRTNKS